MLERSTSATQRQPGYRRISFFEKTEIVRTKKLLLRFLNMALANNLNDEQLALNMIKRMARWSGRTDDQECDIRLLQYLKDFKK